MKKKIFAALMAAMLVMSASCANTPASTTPNASDNAPDNAAVNDADDEDEEEKDEEEDLDLDDLPEEDEDNDEDEDDFVETPAVKLTGAIVDCGIELPMLMIVDDKDMLTDVMGYDLSIMDDYCVRTNIISAQLVEFSVIKPADGKEQEVLDMLNARMGYLKDSAAFYPDQIENADATIVSSYKGYVYLLCEKHSAEEEEALKKAIDNL